MLEKKSIAQYASVGYNKLTPKQKEIYNYNEISLLLAMRGFSCIRLIDDWAGADFIAVHMNGKETWRVQLKSRLTVCKKYEGKDLWMAFPVRRRSGDSSEWYVIKHDVLLDLIKKNTSWLEGSKKWKKEKAHSTDAPAKEFLQLIKDCKLN